MRPRKRVRSLYLNRGAPAETSSPPRIDHTGGRWTSRIRTVLSYGNATASGSCDCTRCAINRSLKSSYSSLMEQSLDYIEMEQRVAFCMVQTTEQKLVGGDYPGHETTHLRNTLDQDLEKYLAFKIPAQPLTEDPRSNIAHDFEDELAFRQPRTRNPPAVTSASSRYGTRVYSISSTSDGNTVALCSKPTTHSPGAPATVQGLMFSSANVLSNQEATPGMLRDIGGYQS